MAKIDLYILIVGLVMLFLGAYGFTSKIESDFLENMTKYSFFLFLPTLTLGFILIFKGKDKTNK